MEISVIIPVYNKAEYIADCIRGILTQDFQSFEIVAVDDGSTDNSGAICDQLAASDHRIRVIHTANGGVTAARRRGVEAALGKYIAFVDADDTLMPHALKRLYDTIEREQADEVVGTFCTQHGTHSPVVYRGLTPTEPLMRAIMTNKNRFCVLWGILFRKEILEGCLDTPRLIIEGEDKMMQMKVLSRQPKVFFTDHCVYYYNIGLPNNRRQTLERVLLYDEILAQLISQWSDEQRCRLREAFSLHQVKEYESFLYAGNADAAKEYRKTLNISSARLPLYERTVYTLPPTLAGWLVKLMKNVILKLYQRL